MTTVGLVQKGALQMLMTSDGVYRTREPMTEDQLMKAAPAVFATGKHGSRSDRYSYVPTIDIVRGLQKEAGLLVYGATESKTKDQSRKGHTKHLIRLRRPAGFNRDEAPELILINSHDGASSYRLLVGLYRFACANGIIAGDGFEGARIRHQNEPLGPVIDATYQVVKDFDRIEGSVDRFKSVMLSSDEQLAYAESAFALRFDDAETAPAVPRDLLRARRNEDVGADLWRVFNRTQEALIRGGQSRLIRTEDSNGRPSWRKKTARAVKGVDQNTAINRALWTLTEKMAALKAA